MQQSKRRIFLIRCMSMLLVAVLLSTDAAAIVKEVYVGGAYSANDLAQSDNRVSMDQVKQDYSDFRQTDWLTEYFHRDQSDPVKPDANEALAWLIDNEIVSRDLSMTISNIMHSATTSPNAVPSVSILKADANSIMSEEVNRSDMIMYLYRAVYGPIDARTIGVETPNIRVDNTSKNTLYRIMLAHDYFTTIQNGAIDGIFQIVKGKDGGNGGVGNNGTGGNGGHGGEPEQKVITSISEAGTWRYTPQGDEYESIFGDTNIFISEVDIDQKVQTGNGGAGGNANANAYGDGSTANAGGGGGGGTGGANAAIQYETDYKQIYYTPAADLIFYRSNDVIEEYLAAVLSKGLLTIDRNYLTERFYETFVDTYNATNMSDSTDFPIWSHRAPARIVNRSRSIQNTVMRTRDTATNLKDTLGVNYNVVFTPGARATLSIQRVNPFQSNTGYFSSEDVTKMDFYRHIYTYISANEKSLSTLETNIINYKYGLDLQEYGSPDDTYIIKYLIAKGIVNFEVKSDVMNLTAPLQYRDFFNILYRVANKDARYDFSKVVLTDSEAQWNSQEYAQRTLYLSDNALPGGIAVTLSDQYRLDSDVDPDIVMAGEGAAVVAYSEDGVTMEGPEPLDVVETTGEELALYAPDEAGEAEGDPTRIGDITVNGLSFDFLGASVYDATSAYDFVDELLHIIGSDKHFLQNMTLAEYGASVDNVLSGASGALSAVVNFASFGLLKPGTYTGDSVSECFATMLSEEDGTDMAMGSLESTLCSIFFISLMQNDPSAYDAVYDLLHDMDKDTAANYIPQSSFLWWSWNDSFLSVDQNFVDICHDLASSIKRYTKGKREIRNVVFHISSQASHVTAAGYSNINSMPIENGYTTLRFLAVNLVGIEFEISVGSGKWQKWYVTESSWERDSGGLKAGATGASNWQPNVTSDAVSIAANAGNDRLFTFTLTATEEIVTTMPNVNQTSAGTGNTSLVDALTYNYKTSLSSAELARAVKGQTSLKVECPSGGSEDGYVNWSSLEASGLPIKKVSDFILQNTETNTYAYFPAPGGETKYALVGTTIVPGDQDEGVCKYVNGWYWYWWDAIKLLVGAKGENAALNGLKGVTLPAEAVHNNLASIPVVYESGYKSNSVYGLRLRLTADKTAPALVDKLRSDPIAKQVWEAGQEWTDDDGWVSTWANFVAVSTANRAMNMVSRKVIYDLSGETGEGGTPMSAFIVMINEVDSTIAGAAGITKDMTLEQVLDSVAQPPSDAEALAKYKENMKISNAVANWIYQTSDVEYINTGYLVPKIYILRATGEGSITDILKQSGFYNMPSEIRDIVYANTSHNFLNLEGMGVVDRPGTSKPRCMTKEGDYDPRLTTAHCTQYYLSKDYKFAVVGDRLYINEWMFSNLEGAEDSEKFMQTGDPADIVYYLSVKNAVVQSTAFTMGRVFSAQGYTDDYIVSTGAAGEGFPTPKMTVVETKSDGTVICQVGPISGMPLIMGGQMRVMYAGMNSFDLSKKLSETANSTATNVYKFVTDVMFANYGGGVKFEPNDTPTVVSKPLLTIPTGVYSTRSYINTGTGIVTYSGKSMYGDESTEISILNVAGSKTAQDVLDAYRKALNLRAEHASKASGGSSQSIAPVWQTETYVNVSFSAYDYTIRDNQLVASSMTAADLLSPSLFVCLNDLIIDKMMDASLGAIPVNEIPAGAMLELGSGFYVAATNDADTKVFVGLSSLDTSFSYVPTPTIQEATYSFGGHFIRGGQQFINVTHYFDEFTVLANDGSGEEWTKLGPWKTALQSTVDYGMSDLGTTKVNRYCNTADGVSYQLVPSAWGNKVSTKNLSGGAQFYAPVVIRLNPILYAYEVAETDGVKRFRLCDHAAESVTGALSNLPFFSDDVLNAKLSDLTGKMRTGGYTFYHGALDLMEQARRDFQKAFAGDLFTLIRMLLFIVLVWLFLMSWVCYGFYASRLMPMVDALCHPTTGSNRKGIDLFKIFSLGTISVDSDFKLGRFLQYDLIIAVLIVIVWKSGNILF